MATLYIVATPIGNLADLTERARQILAAVDIVACEDTRVTARLFQHYDITTPRLAYHQHSPERTVTALVERLRRGENIALVSDAGTPGVNDPGGQLVAAVVAQLGEMVTVVPIPGPSALMTALSISGFPADQFVCYGFIPHKKGRQQLMVIIARQPLTTVVYESTHRIMRALDELAAHLGDRPLVVARELTKQFETIYRGSAQQIAQQLTATSAKGEFVIVVSPQSFHL